MTLTIWFTFEILAVCFTSLIINSVGSRFSVVSPFVDLDFVH